MTTKSTEEMSKELHDWLKRPGECWHTYAKAHWLTAPSFMATCGCEEVKKVRSGLVWNHECINPNFFSPATEDQAAINFFWLWDRMKEYDDLLLDQIEIINSKRGYYLDELIDCEILAKALYEFKETQ